ncbi:MAG: hypothetical protein A3F12_02320 [Gammaproteobacteria bacterium RIFCSPHIGHO2_12_FULL_38_14]|nr:MAG: hypothetical protein A3F12_02320 [Gammaproteobacteria bacterium RIFCSPHIGHO2_12_FULL_38_14]
MVVAEDFQNSIHLILKELIEEKSRRDNVKFTGCQLAQAVGIPRSIITKLTHHDVTKRVTNPKLDTIMKIVEFFKADGFDITVEDLLGSATRTISVKNQQLISQSRTVTIPVYSLKKKEKMGIIDVKISGRHKDTIALYADRDIKPFFKAGSIFIVDPNAVLENDNLIVIKLEHSDVIQIKKYCVFKNKILLKSLDDREKDIILMPTTQFEILGVVVQINANT